MFSQEVCFIQMDGRGTVGKVMVMKNRDLRGRVRIEKWLFKEIIYSFPNKEKMRTLSLRNAPAKYYPSRPRCSSSPSPSCGGWHQLRMMATAAAVGLPVRSRRSGIVVRTRASWFRCLLLSVGDTLSVSQQLGLRKPLEAYVEYVRSRVSCHPPTTNHHNIKHVTCIVTPVQFYASTSDNLVVVSKPVRCRSCFSFFTLHPTVSFTSLAINAVFRVKLTKIMLRLKQNIRKHDSFGCEQC